jgi:hypothetical protein
MSIKNYEPIPIPASLVSDMGGVKQARRYFEWFVSQIPTRLEALRHAVVSNGGSQISLDLSPASLAPLGAWLDTHLELRTRTAQEIERDTQSIPEWLRSEVEDSTFTDETVFLCIDVAIYFAEVLRQEYPALEWDFVRGPKNDADLYQPVLRSFGNAHLNPVAVMLVTAQRVRNGDSAAEMLPRVYAVWTQWAPKQG